MTISSEVRIRRSSAYFCTAENPYAVKMRVEKAIRFLLSRATEEPAVLRFRGEQPPRDLGHRTTLQLVTASASGGDWWAIYDEAFVEARWVTEDKFRRQAAEGFARWCSELAATVQLGKTGDASLALYAARVEEYREREAAALLAAEDDPGEIRALQERLLVALRSGLTLSTVNKEGGVIFGVKAGRYRESHYGDEPGEWFYAEATELLGKIRQHYDWDARAGDYPHRPAEAQVWQFILSKLSR